MSYNITLTDEELEAFLILNKRYYFGLFKEVVKDENEEYILRDTIISIAKQLSESKESVYEKRGLRTL